jgi:lysophospholipase L1-like esterase
MSAIVNRLKQTNARLIWCTTTPIPENSPGRIHRNEIPYNAAAAKIMAAHNIPINDLWSLVTNSPQFQLPNNVHFTPEGYNALAQAVSVSIAPLLQCKIA